MALTLILNPLRLCDILLWMNFTWIITSVNCFIGTGTQLDFNEAVFYVRFCMNEIFDLREVSIAISASLILANLSLNETFEVT